MSTVKVFKRGDVLFKEGDKAQSIFLIQTGSVLLQLTRQKQNIELAILGSSQIAGEHSLWGVTSHPHTAYVQADTKAIELPAEALKLQIEASSQLQKIVLKSLCEKLKLNARDILSMKMERDNTPCPPDQTAKVFGTVFHVARSKGEVKPDGSTKVAWGLMRQYAQRVFLESPKRLETATNIFVKLGWAKYEMGKLEDKPDEPEEILAVHFFDLPAVEQFFEFYQYYYFKGGKMELLRTEEKAVNLAGALVEIAAGEQPDRNNLVRIDYSVVVEKVKTLLGMQINNDHWSLLENKGLYVKRQSTEKGIFIQFDIKEWGHTLKVWKILREVERWNEKGSVDPYEPLVDPKKTVKTGPACPECGHGYDGAPKFCSDCGFKFTAAA